VLLQRLALAFETLLQISRFVGKYSKTRIAAVEGVNACQENYDKFFERIDRKLLFLSEKCGNQKV
jgi:hypothetical protein